MVEKFAVDFVNQMVEIKAVKKDLAEHYEYIAICWIEKMITIGSIVLISMVIKKFVPTLIFLNFFLNLRKRTGGYHLDEFYQCYIATIISYLLIVAISSRLAGVPYLMLGMLLLAVIEISIIGTVNHPNIHMNSRELAESKKVARLMVLLEGSIIGGCVLLKADMLFISYMAIAVILCAALLCVAKILGQEVKESEEVQQDCTKSCREGNEKSGKE